MPAFDRDGRQAQGIGYVGDGDVTRRFGKPHAKADGSLPQSGFDFAVKEIDSPGWRSVVVPSR